jgi:hypothetical protein
MNLDEIRQALRAAGLERLADEAERRARRDFSRMSGLSVLRHFNVRF